MQAAEKDYFEKAEFFKVWQKNKTFYDQKIHTQKRNIYTKQVFNGDKRFIAEVKSFWTSLGIDEKKDKTKWTNLTRE